MLQSIPNKHMLFFQQGTLHSPRASRDSKVWWTCICFRSKVCFMFNKHTLCFLATKRLRKITLLWVKWAFRSEAAGTSRHVLSCFVTSHIWLEESNTLSLEVSEVLCLWWLTQNAFQQRERLFLFSVMFHTTWVKMYETEFCCQRATSDAWRCSQRVALPQRR